MGHHESYTKHVIKISVFSSVKCKLLCHISVLDDAYICDGSITQCSTYRPPIIYVFSSSCCDVCSISQLVEKRLYIQCVVVDTCIAWESETSASSVAIEEYLRRQEVVVKKLSTCFAMKMQWIIIRIRRDQEDRGFFSMICPVPSFTLGLQLCVSMLIHGACMCHKSVHKLAGWHESPSIQKGSGTATNPPAMLTTLAGWIKSAVAGWATGQGSSFFFENYWTRIFGPAGSSGMRGSSRVQETAELV